MVLTADESLLTSKLMAAGELQLQLLENRLVSPAEHHIVYMYYVFNLSEKIIDCGKQTVKNNV